MVVVYRKVKALSGKDYSRYVGIHPKETLYLFKIILTKTGNLTIQKGYANDHASGAFDTKTIIEGSRVHDALCELIHNGLLPDSDWDKAADIMYDINVNSKPKMWKPRAKWIRRAIKIAGPGVTKSREWITV